MEEAIKQLRIDSLVHLVLLQNLWTNYLANGRPDPVETAHRIGMELRASIETPSHEGADLSAEVLAVRHEIVRRTDEFWHSVEQLLAQRAERER